jgi:single-strand DNA-binding protein
MNTVNLIARLTNTPELKQTQNGKSVCNFSVAAERKFKDADGNAIVDFIDCVVWNAQAEFLCKWFDKGVRVGLTGELQTRTYTDGDGKSRKVYEVLVSSVEFADGKREANANVSTPAPTNNTNAFAVGNDDFTPCEDEDLPFL